MSGVRTAAANRRHPPASTLPADPPPAERRNRVGTFAHRHRTIVLGGLLVGLMIAIAILAPWLGTVDPTALAPAQRLREPSARYWFGTDMLGRDIYSRVIYGSRISLLVGFLVALLASTAGTLVGAISGFSRGLDPIVMRVMDGLMSIPPLLLAIALMTLTRASVQNVVIAISVAEFPRVSRLIRGITLSLRDQPYVEAAIASGTPVQAIIWRHIIPNTLAPLMVNATYVCASAIISESILSFIGAGTPPTIPSWGNIMAEGRALWEIKPYVVAFPAVFLCITVLAVNVLGDSMRDALDPRLAKRL